MQTTLDKNALSKVKYLIGNEEIVFGLSNVPAMIPYEDRIIDFLHDVSRELMNDSKAKRYSDVTTFAFWIRKASTNKLKEYFSDDEENSLGKGVVFHIAPSNVPVNFAYSLAVGLLNGNANVVRVPSKDFEQVSVIVNAFNKVLDNHESMKQYIVLVRYSRDKEVNDYFSSICDVRIVWGGDATIAELRRSPLPPRSGEITFADRYSIAVIDSDEYMKRPDKKSVALDFYNDTFFSDQNGCTSPRVVIWMGNSIKEAKGLFWEEEYALVKERYNIQPIQAVNKLTSKYLVATKLTGCIEEKTVDNLIIRIKVPKIDATLMDYRDNSGYFYEYDCSDIMEIKDICNDKHCQTIAYLGNKEMFKPLLRTGIKGVDRIVSIGRTMEFDIIWDGYNLSEQLTRSIVVV